MYAAHRSRPARVRLWLIYLAAAIGLMMGSCSEPTHAPQPVVDERIGAVEAYIFEPDAQYYLATPRPFDLDPQMTVAEALTALAGHLSRTYFNPVPDGDPGIEFEIVKVQRLELRHRWYRLAVVNMVDPRLEALQVYFQGSAGGQTTFYMLTATLLQPQMTPPLLDGLILLYNGDEFPQIDHVNFRGIVTPEMARSVVTKALLHRQEPRPAPAG
jgi:hypothetical protein